MNLKWAVLHRYIYHISFSQKQNIWEFFQPLANGKEELQGNHFFSDQG
jgi:hypothetical protein